MISIRSKLSLCQYLTLHDLGYLRFLFNKHGIPINQLMEEGMAFTSYVIDALHYSISAAMPEHLLSLLEEFVRTEGDLRSRVSPRYRHDERWHDLVHCLRLDGYIIEGKSLRAIEPSIEGFEPFEDDLTKELNHSGLVSKEDIVRLLINSADDFRKVPPDYNGCLSNVRIALETLGKSIASSRLSKYPGSFDDTKWGQILSYLRTSNLISQKEEEGIAGVYSFVCQGTHRPVGLSEQEMARLGRSLVTSMCYFLIKIHNQQES
jgi:hypothetical protein